MTENLKAPAGGPIVSGADMAYAILKREGRPVHYSEIMKEIVGDGISDPAARAREMARIYTEINLDHRLCYTGNGLWSLKDRAAKTTTARVSPARAIIKPRRDNRLRREEPDDTEDELQVEPEEDEEEEDLEEEEEAWDTLESED
jgi:DNA-directed RNA polymerase delta subunit